MKKYFLLITILLLYKSSPLLAQATPAEQVAARIADRLKDSLSLNTSQRTALYQINLQLDQRKQEVRTQYASSPGEWPKRMQRVENSRDSLYRTVLTNEAVFQQYKAKKASLIRVN